MSTCDTCRHWTKQVPTEQEVEFLKYTNQNQEFGVCEKGIGGVANYPDIAGCVGDGRVEDGTGNGITGPKFGCIHWEAR